MDQDIQDYIEKLVEECMHAPSVFSNPNASTFDLKEKIRDYLYKVMVDTLLDNLSADQLNQIKDLEFSDPEMEKKLEVFAAEIPGFAFTLEDKLKQEVENIKANPQITSQES